MWLSNSVQYQTVRRLPLIVPVSLWQPCELDGGGGQSKILGHFEQELFILVQLGFGRPAKAIGRKYFVFWNFGHASSPCPNLQNQ